MSFYVWIIAWWWATSSGPTQLCSVCMMCNSCAILAWGNENLTSLGKNRKPPLWFKLSPWVLKCHEITASSGIWCSRVCCFPKPTGTVKCAGKAYKYFKTNIAAELLRYSLTNKEFWILKALQNAQMHEATVIKIAKLTNTNLNLCELEFSPMTWEGVLSIAVGWSWRKLLNEAHVSHWEGRGTSALLLFSSHDLHAEGGGIPPGLHSLFPDSSVEGIEREVSLITCRNPSSGGSSICRSLGSSCLHYVGVQ